MDLFKLSSITSEHDARKAGAEVVKQTSNAPLVRLGTALKTAKMLME